MPSTAASLIFEQSLVARSGFLDQLLGRSEADSGRVRRRRGPYTKVARRGEAQGVGQAKWRIPIPENVWEELRRPERYDESSWAGKRFQSYHGVPVKIFDELVAEARQHDTLAGKEALGDGRKGPFSKPLELKVAAVLEMCQAGLPFKSAERLYKISSPVLEQFFHDFTRLQVEFEYPKHVYIPESRADIDRILSRHAALGFPGAISMWDGTKWEWGACPHAWAYAHIGKEGYPTKTFMVAGDMNSIIHNIHGSEIGARNDMTISRFDDYLQSIVRGRRFANEVFDLYKGDGSGEKTRHRGLWGIFDNGFHHWRICQCPSKVASEEFLKRWSKRLESVRKPGTECIYGRLKKRFRILQLPCTFTQTHKVDNCFRFLASLHNRLQRHYGLDSIGGEPGDWKSASTNLDDLRIENENNRIRIGSTHFVRNGGLDHLVDDEAVGNDTTPEYDASWSSFRLALVNHFKEAWQKEELLWPLTAAECRPNYRLNPAIRRTGREIDEADE